MHQMTKLKGLASLEDLQVKFNLDFNLHTSIMVVINIYQAKSSIKPSFI
jgi:hypothetical protein